MSNANTTVFVSGATGFIAQHIVRQLLDQDYKVIGSVRSTEKGEHLKNVIFKGSNFSYEIVKDISDLNGFDPVFEKLGKEIKIVIHAASPFHFNTTDIEKDLLIPAINGTKGILESIKKYAAQTVERVVITSSLAANSSIKYMTNPANTINEESWNDDTWEEALSNPLYGYCDSKKFAEKAAWEFYNANKDSIKFKMSVINPVYVFGPQNYIEPGKKVLNTSSEVINSLVKLNKNDEIPQIMGGHIDVRDVAKAHIQAFQRDDLIEQRLFLTAGMFTNHDIVRIMREQFPELKDKLPVPDPKIGEEWLKTGHATYDNSKTKKLLGYEFIDLEKDIHDTVSQILEANAQSN